MKTEKCQVIFLNKMYRPDWLERMRLKDYQNILRRYTIEISNECQDNRYEEVIRVQAVANRLRESWQVLDGGKKEEYKEDIQSS